MYVLVGMNCVPLLHSFITIMVSSHLEAGKGSGGVGTGCRQVFSIWLLPCEKQKYPQMCQETQGSAGKGLPDPQGQLLVGLGGSVGQSPWIYTLESEAPIWTLVQLDPQAYTSAPQAPLCLETSPAMPSAPSGPHQPSQPPTLRGLACPPAASRCSITSKLCLRRDHETRKEGRGSSREVRHRSVPPSPRSRISIRELPPQGPKRRF